MKTNKELLQLLFDEILKVKDFKNVGMCLQIRRLEEVLMVITPQERRKLFNFVNRNKPHSETSSPYWWPLSVYGKTQRLEFLKKLINNC